MENIEFRYCFKDGDEVKEINISRKAEDGFHDYEVCEMFLDFIRSVGFSEENIYKYFQE